MRLPVALAPRAPLVARYRKQHRPVRRAAQLVVVRHERCRVRDLVRAAGQEDVGVRVLPDRQAVAQFDRCVGRAARAERARVTVAQLDARVDLVARVAEHDIGYGLTALHVAARLDRRRVRALRTVRQVGAVGAAERRARLERVRELDLAAVDIRREVRRHDVDDALDCGVERRRVDDRDRAGDRPIAVADAAYARRHRVADRQLVAGREREVRLIRRLLDRPLVSSRERGARVLADLDLVVVAELDVGDLEELAFSVWIDRRVELGIRQSFGGRIVSEQVRVLTALDDHGVDAEARRPIERVEVRLDLDRVHLVRERVGAALQRIDVRSEAEIVAQIGAGGFALHQLRLHAVPRGRTRVILLGAGACGDVGGRRLDRSLTTGGGHEPAQDQRADELHTASH